MFLQKANSEARSWCRWFTQEAVSRRTRKRAGTVRQEGRKPRAGCINEWVSPVDNWSSVPLGIVWRTYRMYLRFALSRDSEAGNHFLLYLTGWELFLRVLSLKSCWTSSGREAEMYRFLRCIGSPPATGKVRGGWGDVEPVSRVLYWTLYLENILFSFLQVLIGHRKLTTKNPL